MLEEAGLEFEPEAVLAVEQGWMGKWMMISFTGREACSCHVDFKEKYEEIKDSF